MNPPIDLSTLPLPAQKILDPAGPAPIKAMAAKGIIPGLRPADIVTVVAALSEWPDTAISQQAKSTLSALPKPVMEGALQAGLQPGVIDLLAEAYASSQDIIEKLLDLPNTPHSTVTTIAKRCSETISERIAVNEARLLACPPIIEALYLNKNTRMSTADRVLELAVRNNIELDIPAFKEAAAAIRDELIMEPSAEPTPDDLLFKQVDEIASTISVNLEKEDTHVIDEEGNEQVVDKCVPLWVQLATMTISQKIRRAVLGTPADRMLLVRDKNRLVASAAIHSPLIQEPEIVRISASRQVDDDVLRTIANNREWTRNYQVKLNLVNNPRTPFSFAAKLIPLLRDNELRQLAKSKNVTGAISQAARQHLQRKQTKENK